MSPAPVVRSALARIEFAKEELRRLVARHGDQLRWLVTDGPKEDRYPDALFARRLARFGNRKARWELDNPGKWGERSRYLALFRRDPELARDELLAVYRQSGGLIRKTARTLGCSANTVYAVLRRRAAAEPANAGLLTARSFQARRGPQPRSEAAL